jgi:hypothetical protein
VCYADLYAAAAADIRAACLKVASVEAVVVAPTVQLLPSAIDPVGSSALVRLSNPSQSPSSVLVAEMPAHAELEEFLDDLLNLLASRGAPTKYGVRARGLGSGREPWTLTFHSPKTTKMWRALGAESDVVPLGSILEVADAPAEAVVTVIVDREHRSCRISNPSDATRAEETAIALRPVAESSAFEVRHAIRFLSSMAAVDQLSRLEAPDEVALLSHLALPMPAADLQSLITGLDPAVADLSGWADEISSIGDLFFTDSSFDVAARRVRSVALRMSQRYSTARAMDGVGPRISASFPWPLALGWHEMARCGPSSLDRYVRALELAEAVSAYVAVMAIMSLRSTPVTLAATNDLSSRFASGHALTFSDWNEVLREASASKVKRILGASHPVPDLDRLFDSQSFEDAIRRLVRKRNAQAHGKGPKDRELSDDIPIVERDLQTLVTHLEFVTTYDLVLVEEARTDAYTARTEFVYRRLMGALPAGLRESGVADEEQPEAGSLHLTDRDGRLVLLRPLLAFANCDGCHGDRAFVVDGAPDGDSVLFKGLAHSHEKTLAEQATALAAIGWLDAPTETS